MKCRRHPKIIKHLSIHSFIKQKKKLKKIQIKFIQTWNFEFQMTEVFII